MLRAALSAALVASACNTPRSPPPAQAATATAAAAVETPAAGGGQDFALATPAGPFPGLDAACQHLLAGDRGGRCRLEGPPSGAAELPRRIAVEAPLTSAVLGVAGDEGRSGCVLALEKGGWYVLPLGPCQGNELGVQVDDLRYVRLAQAGGAVALTLTRKVANGFDVDDDDPVPTTCTQELVVCLASGSGPPRCTGALELARRDETCRAGPTPGGISWQWRLEATVGEDGVVRLAEAAGPLPPDRRQLVGAHRLALP